MTARDGRRRVRIFAFGIATLFAALALVNWWTGRVNVREGSRVVSPSGGLQRFRNIPNSYELVYSVESYAGGKPVTTTEKIWVRRPFESRVESWRGPPPGTTRLSIRTSAFGALTSEASSTAPLNIAAPPSIASGDLRLDAVLRDAVRSRTFLIRERREVFGRRCQVYRAGGPVGAGDITRYSPGTGDYADVCIDRHGLVLEEVWYQDGKLLRRRAAVEENIDPPIREELFAIRVPESTGVARGSVERETPQNERRGDLWEFDKRPKGFDSLGRFVVAFPPSAVPQGASPPVSTMMVYVRGPDLLVIDQDPSLLPAVRRERRPVQRVKAGRLEDALLIVDARSSEVRGETADGSVVRVFGTLDPTELVRLARGLRTS